MKEIDYYTTINQKTQDELNRLDRYGKLKTMQVVINDLLEGMPQTREKLTIWSIFQISGLDPNQSLGLIKALADQCQETVISK